MVRVPSSVVTPSPRRSSQEDVTVPEQPKVHSKSHHSLGYSVRPLHKQA